MGDRVAIIGGSTVGRDHFPFPVSDLSVASGSDTFYPLLVDVDTMCRWFFRVRAWDVVVNSEWMDGFGNSYSHNIFLNAYETVSVADDVWEVPTRESSWAVLSKIGLNAYWEDFEGSFFYLDGSDPLEQGGSVITNFDSNNSDEESNYELSVGFGSPLWVAGEEKLTCQLIWHGTSGNVVFHTFPEGLFGSTPTVCGHLYFDDQTPLPIYRQTPGGSAAHLVSMDVFVDPAEYWEYANKAGDPVYDTSTGAQLTDPLG